MTVLEGEGSPFISELVHSNLRAHSGSPLVTDKPNTVPNTVPDLF